MNIAVLSESDYWPEILRVSGYAGSGIIGAALVWILRVFKLQKQIQELDGKVKKLDAEVTTLKYQAINEAGKTLTEIQKHRQHYNGECEKISDCIRAMISAVNETNPSRGRCETARETFCDALAHHLMPSFLNWMEWEHLASKTDSNVLRNFIEYQVIPELRRFASWQDIINQDRFTKEYKFSPYITSAQNAQPFLKVIVGLNDIDRGAVSPLLNEAIGRIRGATPRQ